MPATTFTFEWDEAKAATNLRKHGVTLAMAASIFHDPHLLTIADLEHSTSEERWFSLGTARNGALLAVAYSWTVQEAGIIRIRLISARRATRAESKQYEEGL